MSSYANERRRATESPFVWMSPGWRMAIIGYVLLYELFAPGLSYMIHGGQQPLDGWLLLTNLGYHALLLLPIMFYRREWGWLHPLIFPVILDIAMEVARNPAHLAMPLQVVDAPYITPIDHEVLWGWSSYALAKITIEAKLIASLGVVCYYIGYFWGPKFGVPKLRFFRAARPFGKTLFLVGVAALIFVFYMQSQGGVMAHLQSWGEGRNRAMVGEGHIFALVQLGLMALLALYSVRPKQGRNPIFWGLVAINLVMLFLTDGSRGQLIFGMVFFVMVWMLHHHRVPKAGAAVFAIIALVGFGVLGQFRTSAYKTDKGIDTSILTNADFDAAYDTAIEEAEDRAINHGFRAVVAKVPTDNELLWGESYVSVLAFWIPRAIWPDKPIGAGAMYNQRIKGAPPLSGGVPISTAGEAYWNFHLIGVVLIFFFFGVFHNWLARTFVRYRETPPFWPIYAITVMRFEPYSPAAVPYIHLLILLLVTMWFFGSIRVFPSRQAKG